jgi:hypothetical protein
MLVPTVVRHEGILWRRVQVIGSERLPPEAEPEDTDQYREDRNGTGAYGRRHAALSQE